MAGTSTGSVQRYQLSGNDTVTIDKTSSSMPELVIGNYHFTLPSNQNELNQVVSQFQSINWSDLKNQGGSTR